MPLILVRKRFIKSVSKLCNLRCVFFFTALMLVAMSSRVFVLLGFPAVFSNPSAFVFLLFDFVAQSFACLLWAGLELFGPHPFVSPDSPCLSLRCCLTLGGLGWGNLALIRSTCLFSVTYCSLGITCLTCFFKTHDDTVIWYVGAFCFGAYAGIL